MKKYILLICFFAQGVFADSLGDYHQLIQKYPKLVSNIGDHTQGEIEIILDLNKIQKIESLQEDRWLRKNLSKAFSKKASEVGLIFEDPYWLIVRDAVMFPSGALGTYNRLILKSSLEKDSSAGVAVLPELEDHRIILVIHYRHATRSWEVEIPRGFTNVQESVWTAAKREVKEETGCTVRDLSLLGEMVVDSGLVNSKIPIFSAKVHTIDQPRKEFSEAILSNVILTKKEVEEGLLKGFLEIKMGDKKRKASMRDSYLSYAVLQRMLQKTW